MIALRFMNEVGLEYLTLDRLSSTLSGGEAQRIQLATSLGSRLVGTLYVLDEPSIGLHSRDTARLIHILKSLRDLGNTILVVEHDSEVMAAADEILDLGPGAGEHGGKLVAHGNYEEIRGNHQSLTGRYLNGDLQIQIPQQRRLPGKQLLRLRGARGHNLKDVDVTIPLGMLVAVTGVSGSGKSTLVHDVLYQRLVAIKRQAMDAAGESDIKSEGELDGEQWIDEVQLVDQSPIGRTPRSNPVTYIKAFDPIRELFCFPFRIQEAWPYRGTLFIQHTGRALRDLLGRRHGDGGDAIPGRRGIALRRLQRHALQAGDSCRALPRKEHS